MLLQTFVEVIQDNPLLEVAAKPVQPLLKEAFRQKSGYGRLLKNFLSGSWLGHPLHPILKDVPIGAWTMAALFDTIYNRKNDPAMQRAADLAIATGVLGALGSAVTGLADWSDTTGRPRRVGVLHAVLNTSATALYCASLVARLHNRPRGVRLAFYGYGLMSLGSYLGGHLVFGERIGVNRAAETGLPTDFVPVMLDSDLLEGEPRRVEAKGFPIVLVRSAGEVYALFERCTHMGGPLAEGTVEGASIRCPWHGSRFALKDGGVIEGPATSPQPCFETRVVDGRIQVRARSSESP